MTKHVFTIKGEYRLPGLAACPFCGFMFTRASGLPDGRYTQGDAPPFAPGSMMVMVCYKCERVLCILPSGEIVAIPPEIERQVLPPHVAVHITRARNDVRLRKMRRAGPLS